LSFSGASFYVRSSALDVLVRRSSFGSPTGPAEVRRS
jgi:hypothetical protein